jgi:hypothetical protein
MEFKVASGGLNPSYFHFIVLQNCTQAGIGFSRDSVKATVQYDILNYWQASRSLTEDAPQ